MKPGWEALATRARGLGTHLLDPSHVRRLESVPTLSGFAHELESTVYQRFLPPRVAGAESLETAVARSLAERLGTLARWAGADGELLAVVFLEQDLQSVRTLLRGAVGGLGPEQRLAGTVPTPALPRKALEVLARAETPAAIAATLAAWGHPLGGAFATGRGKAHADPFHMEVALSRRFAGEAHRRSAEGGRHMRRFVAEALDEANAVTALLLAGSRSEAPPEELFVEGGRSLSTTGFSRAASAESRPAAVQVLAVELRGTRFAAPLSDATPSPAALAARLTAARIDGLRAGARLDPVSPLPVLLFVLALREEGRRLRRGLWRAALARGGAP